MTLPSRDRGDLRFPWPGAVVADEGGEKRSWNGGPGRRWLGRVEQPVLPSHLGRPTTMCRPFDPSKLQLNTTLTK